MQRDLQKQCVCVCVCVLVHLCQPLCSAKLWKVVKARQNLLQVAYKQVRKCFILICSGEEDAGAQHLICTGLASEPFQMISHQRSLFTTVLATFRSGHSVWNFKYTLESHISY